MVKTQAERAQEYRSRIRANKPPKKSAKTPQERTRDCRERKKQLLERLQRDQQSIPSLQTSNIPVVNEPEVKPSSNLSVTVINTSTSSHLSKMDVTQTKSALPPTEDILQETIATMNSDMDPSDFVVVKLEPPETEDSTNTINEHESTPESSTLPLEDEHKPDIDSAKHFFHVQIKSEGHASFSSNYIDHESQEDVDISVEHNITTPTSIQPIEQYLIDQKPLNNDYFKEHVKAAMETAELSSNPVDVSEPSEKLPFSCDLCPYAGISKGALSSHRSLHFTEKRFTCSECSFRSHTNNKLVIHLRTHSGERPFACEFCTYRCSTGSGLRRHKLRHGSEKKYQCSFCDYKSRTKCSVVVHERIHSGERPFACGLCDYRCSSSSVLARHKLCHSSEKSYECSECDYRGQTRRSLVGHIRVHSGEGPYSTG